MKYSRKTHKPDPAWITDWAWWCTHPECRGEGYGTKDRPTVLLRPRDDNEVNEPHGTCKRHATKALWAEAKMMRKAAG